MFFLRCGHDIDIFKKVTDVGFEPTHPKILVPKTSALDHSAIQPLCVESLREKMLLQGLEPWAIGS